MKESRSASSRLSTKKKSRPLFDSGGRGRLALGIGFEAREVGFEPFVCRRGAFALSQALLQLLQVVDRRARQAVSRWEAGALGISREEAVSLMATLLPHLKRWQQG